MSVGRKTSIGNVNAIAWVTTGTLIGALAALLLLEKKKSRSKNANSELDRCIQERRRRLPELIILLRHGESEAQADDTLWRTKPDNMIKLSRNGTEQSKAAGKRIENLFKTYEKETSKRIQRVQIHVSPFERTLQTAMAARPYFDHRVVQTLPESRIREQEAGNFSKRDVETFREQQLKVGRFWYRFPMGESGADVYDRVKSWWNESVLTTNERVGYETVDALVVVTHSLSMRFVLMQLYNWSPTTFLSVWNTEACGVYVLRKDLCQQGMSPYILDRNRGDMPRSSIDAYLTFKKDKLTNSTETKNEKEPMMYRVKDYLDVPPPRMRHISVIKQKLGEQYPELDVTSIETISFKVNDTEIKGEEHELCHKTPGCFSRGGENDENKEIPRLLTEKSFF